MAIQNRPQGLSMLRQDISRIPNVERIGKKAKEEPEPDEQMMPWLQLSHASLIQQQNLRQLFDTAKSKEAFEKQLTELLAMQKADGGLSWFKGGNTDDVISAYVLAGLGKMYQDQQLDTDWTKSIGGYPDFLSRLIAYIDKQLTTEKKWTSPVDFLYARSYWLKDHPISASANPGGRLSFKKLF